MPRYYGGDGKRRVPVFCEQSADYKLRKGRAIGWANYNVIEEKRREAQRKDYLFGDQPQRERRLFKDDGTPTQMNTAKWPFSIDEDGASARGRSLAWPPRRLGHRPKAGRSRPPSAGLNVYVDVALPKFLDSAMVGCAIPTLSSPLALLARLNSSGGCAAAGR